MPSQPNLDVRTARRRSRWRRLNRAVTGGVGVLAVLAGISLGITAPATSPAQPSAAPTTTAPSSATAGGASAATGTAGGTAPTHTDRRPDDGRRFRMVGSDGRHR